MEKVFIARKIYGLEKYSVQFALDVWEDVTNPPSAEELLKRTRGCAGLVSMLTERLDAAFFDAVGPGLRVVSQYAVGVNNIDLAYAKAKGIPVGHTPGVVTDATADMAWALLLSGARNVALGVDYVRQGHWRSWEPALLLGHAVFGATLGIIGFGRIGSAVAARSRGFQMRVLASHPHTIGLDWVEQAPMERVLRDSDFVVLAVPLRADTRHLIGAAELALMKPTALIINVARGEIVDPDALFAALKAGRPGGAALDVTEPEPMSADHPLLTLPNCLIVPHLGTSTLATRLAMTDLAMQNLARGLAGEPMLHRANP
jgi:lactate dehydrogenase-like 2-hydroxyacid dehydrogenase